MSRRRYPGVSWGRGWVRVHRFGDEVALGRASDAAVASHPWVMRDEFIAPGLFHVVRPPPTERVGGAALRERLEHIAERAARAASKALMRGAR